MRCGMWATVRYFDGSVCGACATDAERVYAAREAAQRRAGVTPSESHRADVHGARMDALDRAMRERRGEVVEATGWLLW